MADVVESNIPLYREHFYSVTLVDRDLIPQNVIKKALYFAERLLLEMPFIDISYYSSQAIAAVKQIGRAHV